MRCCMCSAICNEFDYRCDLIVFIALRWVFKQLYDRGMVYRGYKVMPYSTACSTPLSNFEAGQNYKDVIDPASECVGRGQGGGEGRGGEAGGRNYSTPKCVCCGFLSATRYSGHHLVSMQSLSTFHWRKTLALVSSPGQPPHGPSLAT